MAKLTDFRVAVIAANGFEESELTEPVKALRKAGAQVSIANPISVEEWQLYGWSSSSASRPRVTCSPRSRSFSRRVCRAIPSRRAA